MELKVWVEGIQRIVCGVTVNTTCQDVVFALAHATGQMGRFTLIERWRNNERLLAPSENPLKLLSKWGEYANDVQFILKRIEMKQAIPAKHQQQQNQKQQQQNSINDMCNEKDNSTTVMMMLNKKPSLTTVNNFINHNRINVNRNNNNNSDDNNISKDNSNNKNNNNNNNNNNDVVRTKSQSPVQQQKQEQQKLSPQNMEINLNAAHERAKEFKKCFGPVDSCMKLDNVGIVKGIPQNAIQNSNLSKNDNSNSNDNDNEDDDDDDDDDDNMSTVVYMNSNQYYEIEGKTSNTDITVARHNPDRSLVGIIHHEKSHSNPVDMVTDTMLPTPLTVLQQQQQDATKNEQQLNNFNKSKMKSSSSSSNNNSSNNNNLYQYLGTQHSKSTNEINLAEVRNALDRGTATSIISPTFVSKSNSTNIIDNINNNKNDIIFTKMPTSMENLMDIFPGSGGSGGGLSGSTIQANDNQNKMLNSPIISANGALVPPPYRDPPPPRQSPLQLNHGNYNVTMQQQQQQQLQHQQNQQSYIPITTTAATTVTATAAATTTITSNNNHIRNSPQITTTAIARTTSASFTKVNSSNSFNSASSFIHLKDYPNYFNSNSNNNSENLKENDYEIIDYEQFHTDDSKSTFPAAQYHDLLQLIKYQREKISAQQKELNKYDAEIVYLEAKERDQAQELEAISREISLADQLFCQGSEQLQTLQYVEEENELVKQQEKTLKSEIALLRSKLSNCETELLQCKNKIRLLMDDLEIEQRTINSKQNKRQHIERDFLMEMERIQSEIDQAIHNTDTSNKSAENLKKEILLIENAIAEKKRQVEQLVNEMKEVNLQSLTVTTSDEIKHFLEGSNKPGSSRRIIGSPRQLENAVPTSKNPHGVWV